MFLGPFGGNTVLALIPSLERFFNADISFIAASILLSTFGFVGIATASVAGYLTDFIGRKRTLLTGLIIMLGAFLIFLHVNTYRAFFISISIMGIGSIIGSITVFTSLNTMIVECGNL